VIPGTWRTNGAFLVDVDVGVVGPDGVDGGHAWDHEAKSDFDYAMICQKDFAIGSMELLTLRRLEESGSQ
jgi:hypothetical protein